MPLYYHMADKNNKSVIRKFEVKSISMEVAGRKVGESSAVLRCTFAPADNTINFEVGVPQKFTLDQLEATALVFLETVAAARQYQATQQMPKLAPKEKF